MSHPERNKHPSPSLPPAPSKDHTLGVGGIKPFWPRILPWSQADSQTRSYPNRRQAPGAEAGVGRTAGHRTCLRLSWTKNSPCTTCTSSSGLLWGRGKSKRSPYSLAQVHSTYCQLRQGGNMQDIHVTTPDTVEETFNCERNAFTEFLKFLKLNRHKNDIKQNFGKSFFFP